MNIMKMYDNNNKILYGKIVVNLEECKMNKTKYTLKKVIGYTMIENTRELYIIY